MERYEAERAYGERLKRRDAETQPNEVIVEVKALCARAKGVGLAGVPGIMPPPDPALARTPDPIVVQMGAARMHARKPLGL